MTAVGTAGPRRASCGERAQRFRLLDQSGAVGALNLYSDSLRPQGDRHGEDSNRKLSVVAGDVADTGILAAVRRTLAPSRTASAL